MGLSGEPRSPALTVGILSILAQFGGGTVAVACGAATVATVVAAPEIAVATVVAAPETVVAAPETAVFAAGATWVAAPAATVCCADSIVGCAFDGAMAGAQAAIAIMATSTRVSNKKFFTFSS